MATKAKKKPAKAVVRQVASAAGDAARKAAMVKIVMENTGWRGADLETAVAIMLRESGGNPGAYNGNRKTGDDSYGLFQLNTLGSLWKIYQGMGITDRSQLWDAATNAKAAYALYQRNGNTFRPWLGYRPGLTVAKQLPEAKTLVAQTGTAPVATVGKSVPLRTQKDPSGGAFFTGAQAKLPSATKATPQFEPVEKIPTGGEVAAGLRAVQAQIPAKAPVFQPVEARTMTGEVATGMRAAAAAKTAAAPAPAATVGKSVAPSVAASYANGKIPADQLVSVQGGMLEANAAGAYQRMVADAAKQGVQIGITDSYRSYDQQVDLVNRKGLYTSTHRSGGAKPGTSEHGWGQAIDVRVDAAGQAWLGANATKYGFEQNTPGEPWHFGYVGPGSVKHPGQDNTWAQADAASLGVDLPADYGVVPDTHGNGFSSGDPAEDLMRGTLGWMSAFLDNPEVGPILRASVGDPADPTDDWTDAQLQGVLQDTDWWRNTQASARTFDGNLATDPATINAQITSKMAEIQAQAATLGFSIDPGHLRDLAVSALRLALTDVQVAHAIGGEALRAGTLGQSLTHQNVRQTASDYGVPMSDSTIDSWTRNIATGTATAEDLREQLVNQAKGLYPSFSDGIDRGLTVRDLADPYVQLASQDLEVDPDTISFADPKWSGAISGTDPKTGVRSVLPLDQYRQKIRSDPVYGWQNTANARASTYSFAAQLGKAFGTYAGTQ